MKYCLSYKVDKDYLRKADEISIPYYDDEKFFEIKEINPEATIVLQLIPDSYIDWSRIEQMSKACGGNLKVMTITETDMVKASEKNLQCFMRTPVHSFETLRSLQTLGATEAIIAGDLAHNMKLLGNFTTTFRIVPNQAFVYTGIDPIIGSWVRPEDIDSLEYISVCQFFETDKKREQALYRIYAEEKEWAGPVNMLVKDIKDNKIINRMLPPEFQQQRNNCGWKCISGKIKCHMCNNNTYLANPELYKEIINK